MKTSRSRFRFYAVTLIGLLHTAPALALCTTQALDLMRNLNGPWRGRGAITPPGAAPEFISCKVNYSMTGETEIHQQLACAGTDYKVEATSDVTCEGNLLSGTFSENATNSTGHVSGNISGNHITIEADGISFKGVFQVVFKGVSNHLVSITKYDPQQDRQFPLASIQLTR